MARRPATSPEGREDQLIDLAVDLAEKQLMEGTASSMVIAHFLKMGSGKERLEREKLRRENEHLRAKTEALESTKRIESLYQEAMSAWRGYSGGSND